MTPREALLALIERQPTVGETTLEIWAKNQKPPLSTREAESLVEQLCKEGLAVETYKTFGGEPKRRWKKPEAPQAQPSGELEAESGTQPSPQTKAPTPAVPAKPPTPLATEARKVQKPAPGERPAAAPPPGKTAHLALVSPPSPASTTPSSTTPSQPPATASAPTPAPSKPRLPRKPAPPRAEPSAVPPASASAPEGAVLDARKFAEELLAWPAGYMTFVVQEHQRFKTASYDLRAAMRELGELRASIPVVEARIERLLRERDEICTRFAAVVQEVMATPEGKTPESPHQVAERAAKEATTKAAEPPRRASR